MTTTISIEWAPSRDAVHERMDKICREQFRGVGNREVEAELRAEHYASLADDLRRALQPFALAGEERVRRPINHPLLPDWAWNRAANVYRDTEPPKQESETDATG